MSTAQRRSGSSWIDLSHVRRRSGSSWIDVDFGRRRSGSSWIDVWPLESEWEVSLTVGSALLGKGTTQYGYSDSLGHGSVDPGTVFGQTINSITWINVGATSLNISLVGTLDDEFIDAFEFVGVGVGTQTNYSTSGGNTFWAFSVPDSLPTAGTRTLLFEGG